MYYPPDDYDNAFSTDISTISSPKVGFDIATVVAISFASLILVGTAIGIGLGVGFTGTSESDLLVVTPPIVGTTTSTSPAAIIESSTTASVATRCTCGCSPVSIGSLLSRVINGVTATANSWPWMVYVVINSNSVCGGFLVDYQHVVTAAHCVPNGAADTVDVYAGLQKVSLRTDNDRRRASAILPHPSFNPTTLDNDIAVLKLASNYTPSSKVGPCCLPLGTTSLPTTSQRALIMGWGTTIDGVSSSTSDDLLQAVVQIEDSSTKCTVSSIKFCAGLGTTDTCQGDSGGPLLTNVNNQWTCTGVVSAGVGCTGFGSYTRVSAFRSFIDNAIQTL